jgi:hypothetical protein
VTVTVKWYGDKVKREVHAAAAHGLFLGAEHVLQVSRGLVPIEEGTLERSGATDIDRGALRAAVSYDTPYAVRQHEEMDYHHDAGRQAKYLEQPLNTEHRVALSLIAREIKRALGG